MKQFACRSVVPECHAVFRDHDVDGLLLQVVDHAFDDHPMTELTPELVRTVRSNIQTIAA